MQNGSFNDMWLCEAYNIKDNKHLNCHERIWHRAWLESVAIRNIPYFAKRKSNYFFKKNFPYNENEVLELSQENLPTVYLLLEIWAGAKGLDFDLKNLQHVARHLFDFHARVFLIAKCQKEIEAIKFFSPKMK